MDITLLLLGISILAASGAQLLIKRGALLLGNVDFSSAGFFGLVYSIIKNFYIVLGLALLGVSFFLWILIVSKKQLSIVYPISSSLTIVLVAFFSWLLFKEAISTYQVLGICLIVLGIFFVSLKF